MRALEQYEWPGNVREMENRIKRAVIMSEGQRITTADLELESLTPGRRPGLTLKQAREAVEKEVIERALARHKSKISRAAEELGVSRPTLYDLMEKLGIGRGED
jgi:two-component system NtrC family response regulator